MNIKQYNAKGQPHGYWECYWGNGELMYKCVFINGKRNALEEWYLDFDGKVTDKTYYI